jgi:ATP-dependent Clp protease, protease subunit
MATPANQLPAEVYGLFSDAINQASVQRIFNTFGIACTGGVRHAHILFQSNGGFVTDGVALYNFFRAVPIEVTLYNVGGVQSIATVAFLGATHRRVSASAIFQIHQTTSPAIAAKAAQLQAIAEGVQLDDSRTEAILRQHLRLPADRWEQLGQRDLIFGAQEAVDFGFADEIGDFSPPPGAKVFNI